MSVESTDYIGCPCEMENLRTLTTQLNAKVVEQVNETQELVMLNKFAWETNECHFKQCLRERMSDIASWRWVLEDLGKRLDDAKDSLKYEHNALRVVGQRVENEIHRHSQEGTRPGALIPMCDNVEQAIFQELSFLRDQKKKFEKLILELEKQVNLLEKAKKRIVADILHKDQALSVEENCACIDVATRGPEDARRKKKRGSPVKSWENRCMFLKRTGLRALGNAIVAKQQVRGARAHLSVAAQAYAARVDSVLRRRLHTNKIKLQDLKWQKEEAVRDYESLQEELETTENNIIETVEQERLVEARRSDRFLRPAREMTKDNVDRNLRDELGRLKSFSKQLRHNLDRITSLQNNLTDSLTRIDGYADDLIQVISLDEERLASRQDPSDNSRSSASDSSRARTEMAPPDMSTNQLTAIREEEDEDDYPFDD